MARRISVEIVGDASSLERAFKKSSRSAARFQGDMDRTSRRTSRSFSNMRRSLVGLGAGVGVTAAIKSSISAASDLEQQISKTDVVFGQSAAQVEAWSKTTTTAFGLSQREALTTASTFGALFKPIGLIGPAAAKQSEQLTQLGADLASFYNTDVASALDAVRSGIVGESEPLRKYGVLLSETRVQQEALRQTGKKHTADLTAQEKVLARVAIIVKDSETAQGDFARTSETAANQTKIFQANIENLEAALGAKLIPTLTEAATEANKLFDRIGKGEDFFDKIGFGFLNRGLLDVFKPHLGRDVPVPVAGMAAADVPRPGEGGRRPRRVAAAAADAARLSKAARQALRDAREAARARVRQSREAARQEALDRAEFAVEKTEATKTLKDDLAALRRYNQLLAKRIRGGHGTLELEREQFRVQQQIADVLKQQADLAKKTRKRLGVDVTRFQKTARGQFALAGAAGGGRGVVISGGVHLHGVQNVAQLENELARRNKQRAHQRRRR